jgi:hypothetical protein
MIRPTAFKGLRNQPIKVKPPVPMAVGAAAKRQGLSQEDLDLDQMMWNQGATPKMTADKGIFAPDPAEQKGAFGGMASAIRSEASGMTANLTKAPPMVEQPQQGPGLLDYLGLAGATLSEIGSDGRKGSINDFMDRRTAANQQSEMNSLLEGLDLTPEELGMVKAGQGQAVLAQRIEDQGEDKRYRRGRVDTVADRDTMRGYQLDDRKDDQTFQSLMQDDDQTFRGGQFDRSLDQQRTEHRDTMALGRDRLASEENIASGKRSNGWTPAGLLSAYTRNNTFVDNLESGLGDMSQVAAESAAFQENAGKSNLVGPGLDKSIGRFFNGLFGGENSEVKTMERNTKSISSLLKKPGGGAWTDADQKVAESYAVNIENSPEANNYAAAIASNRERRQRDYVDFLRENIDEQDPTSLQRAKQIWSEYARDNPMFMPDGTVNDTAAQPPIDTWMQSRMQREAQGMATGNGPVKVPDGPDAEAFVAQLPRGTKFIAPDGVEYTKK